VLTTCTDKKCTLTLDKLTNDAYTSGIQDFLRLSYTINYLMNIIFAHVLICQQ